MRSSVKANAKFEIVSNAVYRQIRSAAPFRDNSYHRAVYIGDVYEMLGWILLEKGEYTLLLWMITITVLETETHNQLNKSAVNRYASEHGVAA